MGGRNYLPPNALIEDRIASAAAGRFHPALVEERVAAQHRDIQSLLLDNQRFAATHVALKQELAAANQELRHLSAAAAEVKAQRDAQVREVYERALKMEAEVRSADELNLEMAQVTVDIQKLAAERRELKSKLQTIDGDLVKARSDLQQLPAIKAEIEHMHQEVQRGRAAVEYEKRTHAANLQQGQAMEKNMMAMAQDIEKLRAEFANADKRARAAAVVAAAANPSPGYTSVYGNNGVGYAGSSYPDPYVMHQVQGSAGAVAGAGLQYGSGVVVPHGPYDLQRTHVQR